ncbi:MAG: TIGR04255 family protein [Ignavibacteriae bacterium]|nr:TIGR04255 family protein [Ignavibacteria bacterium]MBI3365038.1 TIGR04255 family protein [Ignavibacteriota bacterium]
MDQAPQSYIDTSEKFPHLSRAPITEAVIEIRGRASLPWNETDILTKLKQLLTGYPEHRSVQGFSSQLQWTPGQEPKVDSQNLGWQGWQFTSADKSHITKFQLDLFSFSRLKPYENWQLFSAEALRLWEIHFELAQPSEIQRLGVRFINRFPIIGEKRVQLEDYFRGFPDDLREMNLTRVGFLHHDIFAVPGSIYAMNLIKTVQPPEGQGNEFALILDIDVYTQQPFGPKSELLKQRLVEIDVLKNKAFFGIITEDLLKTFI